MTRDGRVRSAAATLAACVAMLALVSAPRDAGARDEIGMLGVAQARILKESPWPGGNPELTGPIHDPSTPGYAISVASDERAYVALWDLYDGGTSPPAERVDDRTESAILAAWHAPCGYREFQRVEVTAGAVVEVVLSEYHRRPCAEPTQSFTQSLVLAVSKDEMPEGEVVVRLRSDTELIGQTRGVLRPVGWEPPVDDPALPVALLVAGGLLTLLVAGGIVAVVRRDRLAR